MPEIKNNFLQGKMNKDLDDRLLPNGQYRDAMNITVSKTENSDMGTAQNIKGNTIAFSPTISIPLSNDGNNTPLWDIIGYHADSITGYIFWFVTSFKGSTSDKTNKFKSAETVTVLGGNITHVSGSDSLAINSSSNTYNIQVGMKFANPSAQSDTYIQSAVYDSVNSVWNIVLNKNTTSQITSNCTLTHTCQIYLYDKNNPSSWSGTPIINSSKLNLSKIHKITATNLIDDLFFWTDNYNQPRRINIASAKNEEYADNIYLEDNISVAKYAPYSAPRVKMEYDASIESDHILNEFVKFGYRFKYDNNEYSLISPFTQHCFHPGTPENDFNTGNYNQTGNFDAGVIKTSEEDDIYKSTVVENMQNKANKISLLLDLPWIDGIENSGAANINGNTSSSNVTIDAINGTINSANDIMVTEEGDTYHVASYSSNTIGLAGAPSPVLADNTRVYFFSGLSSSAPFSFQNNLKIKKIEIVYSESDSSAIKVVDQIEFETSKIKLRAETITNDTARLKYVYEFVYKSTKPLKTLAEREITRVSDVVPIKAKAQEISGNRIIYGNFLQNRSFQTAITGKDFITTSGGDQSTKNKQYLLSSVKSNRTYQIGLVLSDRFGRQSTVILPDDSTVFLQPKTSNVLDGVNSWNHYSLKATFNSKIEDAYDTTNNPLGWYSYRIVVKQTEQEYYNVYTPGLIDSNASGFLVLHGDNINKVPRDVTDVNTDTGAQGSRTKLLPKIINTSGTKAQQGGKKFIDVISIGNALEQGATTPATSPPVIMPELFNTEKNPLVAELPIGYGQTFQSGFNPDDLSVFETEPFKSALDIYYETSSAGLVSDLNAKIDANLGSGRADSLLLEDDNGATISSFAESKNFSTASEIANLKVLDEGSSDITGSCAFSINRIEDGSGTLKPGVFSISNGTELHITENFEHKGTNEDVYSIIITVSKSGVTENFTKEISILNSNPSISIGNNITVAASTNSNTVVKTITAVNGSSKTTANTNGLQFSITSQTKNGNNSTDFSINQNTGQVSTATGSLTDTDVYSITVQVADGGNATASGTFSITIGAAQYNKAYRSQNGVINSDPNDYGQVYNEPTGVDIWHNGTGTYPVVNNIIFSNSSGSSVFNSGGAWYAISAPDPLSQQQAIYVFKTNSSGVVIKFELYSGPR